MKLPAKAAGGDDPQVNYTLQYWQLYQATYDGLLAFTKAGGEAAFNVVLDIAETIPTPTNGGKTWVFKIRKGIRFSNGKEVTPGDVLARSSGSSRSRARRPAGSTPASSVTPEEAGDLHAEGRRQREPRRAPSRST